MFASNQFPSSVIRPASPSASCTCEHSVYCVCGCHGRHCDPTENACDVAYVPDEGGLARWGCSACTPGEGSPHYLGCDLMGWSVPIVRQER